MNTVMSFKLGNETINFTHRNDEFRIVTQKEQDDSMISLLDYRNIKEIESSSEDTISINNYRVNQLQNSKPVTTTILNKKEYIVELVNSEERKSYQLKEDDWDRMFNYLLNGSEGRVEE